MRMFVVLFLVLSISVAYPRGKHSPTSDTTYVLSGEDYAFALTVPDGWLLEPGEGTWSGTKAILRPQGVSASEVLWGNPDAWITVGIASKRIEAIQTLKNLLTFSAKVDSQETATVTDHPSLVTADKRTVLVKQKVRPQSYGAVAYIDDDTIVAVFELRRFDRKQFDETFVTFKQIVSSYRSVAVNKKPVR